jgi:membrane-bound metal-dependent hydrolase YbcI (DUF457 family)
VTSYEHVMLGVTGSLAVGLHRRYGWPIVAVAGAAALLPDWDGLSLALGAAAFDRVHRAWGHNLLVAVLTGAALASLEYRFRWVERTGLRFARRFAQVRPDRTAEIPQPRRPASCGLAAWIAVGVAASLSHTAADVFFSGHATLPNWGIRLLWPFSERAWAYPMVPWGDPGATLIFAAGMFGMLRWAGRVQQVAAATLIAVVVYVLIRGGAVPRLWT